MRIVLLLLVPVGCTASPVLTTPAQLSVHAPDEAASQTNAISAYAIARAPSESEQPTLAARGPTIIAFTHSPPGTECRLAAPPFAKLRVVFSNVPPLFATPGPPPIAIDVAVIAPIFTRSAAQLDLVPETREPIGALFPDDEVALSGRFSAHAATIDGSTQLEIAGSYDVDVCD